MKKYEFNFSNDLPEVFVPAPLPYGATITTKTICFNDLNDNEESLKKEMERSKIESEMFMESFTGDNFIPQKIEWISIVEMLPIEESYNYFPVPSECELSSLMNSIELNGILSPLILYFNKPFKKYIIVCGQSRYIALRELYNSTKLERYLSAPSIILNDSMVNDFKLKSIIIDSNMSYRKIPAAVKRKAAVERCVLLRNTKSCRTECNIAQLVSEFLNMSVSSIYNYTRLSRLSDRLLALFDSEELSLRSATLLTKVTMKKQELLLKVLGLKELNNSNKLNILVKSDISTEEKIIEISKRCKNICKPRIKISVDVHKKHLRKVMAMLLAFKRECAIESGKKSFKNEELKIKTNMDDMTYIEKAGYVKNMDKYLKRVTFEAVKNTTEFNL